MATTLTLEAAQLEKLQKAMQNYQGNTEKAINDVLHNEGGALVQEMVRLYIPVSGKQWKGKKPAAFSGKSLTQLHGNLSVTVTTTKNYQYLYFPDDGTSTKRHVGRNGIPLRFFERGGEAALDDVTQLCINKLVNEFEEGV